MMMLMTTTTKSMALMYLQNLTEFFAMTIFCALHELRLSVPLRPQMLTVYSLTLMSMPMAGKIMIDWDCCGRQKNSKIMKFKLNFNLYVSLTYPVLAKFAKYLSIKRLICLS